MEIPAREPTSNTLNNVPLRISKSTNTVFRLAKAKLVAKLVEMKVLPDDTINEVNMTTCAPCFLSFMYSRLDLIKRNDSDKESRPFSRTIMACPGMSFSKGTSPKKGTLEVFCTSTRSWMVVSSRLLSSKNSTGMARPIKTPISTDFFSSGAIGLPLG